MKACTDSPTSTLGERYIRWWLDDFPPVDGRLRFIFYSGLLYLTKLHSKSFFRAIKYYEKTDPELYNARGLMGFLGVEYIDPDTLRTVMLITKVVWVFSAIGLFTRFSSVATAAGVLFLHGMLFDATGGNRSWYISVYSLIAMAFASSSDPWSVDFHLWKFLKRSEPDTQQQHRSIFDTGFARKCVLIMVVAFYFASGLGKLYTSGLRWADGKTLQYQADGRDEPLAPLLTNNLWLCTILSIGSLFVEVGAILMLFSTRIRYIFLILLSMMHTGIKYSMGPFYFGNVWCFMLLVEWGEVGRWVRSHWLGCRLSCALARRSQVDKLVEEAATLKSESSSRPPLEIGTPTGVRKISAHAATTCGTALLVLMAVVSFFQIEWWPVTNVDLYATYNTYGIKDGYPRSYYSDVSKVQWLARTGNRHVIGQLTLLVEFRLITENGKKRLKLDHGVGVSRPKQWTKSVLHKVIKEDFLAKPEGDISWDPKHPNNPASLFLRHILPSVKRNIKKWKDYDYAVLRYKQEETSDILIAKVPLEDPDWVPPDEVEGKAKPIRAERGSFTSTLMPIALFLSALGLLSYTNKVRVRTYIKRGKMLLFGSTSEELPTHETVALTS